MGQKLKVREKNARRKRHIKRLRIKNKEKSDK